MVTKRKTSPVRRTSPRRKTTTKRRTSPRRKTTTKRRTSPRRKTTTKRRTSPRRKLSKREASSRMRRIKKAESKVVKRQGILSGYIEREEIATQKYINGLLPKSEVMKIRKMVEGQGKLGVKVAQKELDDARNLI